MRKYFLANNFRVFKIFLIFTLLFGSGFLFISNPSVLTFFQNPGDLDPEDLPEDDIQPGESPPADEYFLQPGYKLELVSDHFTFPTMVTFGKKGEVYVSEAGYSYGPATSIPRILQIMDDGSKKENCPFTRRPHYFY
jgi:hypothetical protein